MLNFFTQKHTGTLLASVQKISRVGEQYIVEMETSEPINTIQNVIGTIPFTREATLKSTDKGTYENFTVEVISKNVLQHTVHMYYGFERSGRCLCSLTTPNPFQMDSQWFQSPSYCTPMIPVEIEAENGTSLTTGHSYLLVIATKMIRS